MNEILSNSHDGLSIAKNLVSNYSPQVLEIALLYAHYLDTYGVSITEMKETAVQQKEMLDRAYVRGRHDERETNATKEQREQLDLMRAKSQMNIKPMMDDLIRRQDAADFLCDWCGICSKEKRNIMECDDIAPNFARIPFAQHRPFCYLDSPCPYQNEEIKVEQKKGIGDVISRQAAIEVIDAVFPVDPMKSEYAQGIACGAALAKTYVEQLPSAQQWIPCSERLPEEDGDYLVCYEEGYRKDYGFSEIGIAPFEVDCEGFGIWQEEFDLVSMGSLGTEFVEIDVYAWMPLPEPYKEGVNG